MNDYISGTCKRCGYDIWASDGACHCREEEALDRLAGFQGYVSGGHTCGHKYMEGCEEFEWEELDKHLASIACDDCRKQPDV